MYISIIDPIPIGPEMYFPISFSADPIFIPKKHTKQSYAAQNRAAKKRRNNKQKR